jgi:hypothetical protein
LAVEVEIEAITVAKQASSLTMSPDHFEDDTGPAPRRNGLRKRLCYTPRWSAVGKKVLHDIYSRQAQAAYVTAADLQAAERHGGDGADIDSLSPYAFFQVTNPRNVLFCSVAQPVTRATVSAVVCPTWRDITQAVGFH